MVAGADRHVRLVQDGADVMRMHPLDGEGDDPGAILRPEQPDGVDRGQRLSRLPDQRCLIGCLTFKFLEFKGVTFDTEIFSTLQDIGITMVRENKFYWELLADNLKI